MSGKERDGGGGKHTARRSNGYVNNNSFPVRIATGIEKPAVLYCFIVDYYYDGIDR